MKAQVSSDKEKLKEYLTFQIHRNIVNIYKQQLVLLQDIVVEHERMINKLHKHVDKKTLEDVNYLDQEKYNYLRKKTLDVGNEAIRDFERSVENINITLK
jgi:hypothetical protein